MSSVASCNSRRVVCILVIAIILLALLLQAVGFATWQHQQQPGGVRSAADYMSVMEQVDRTLVFRGDRTGTMYRNRREFVSTSSSSFDSPATPQPATPGRLSSERTLAFLLLDVNVSSWSITKSPSSTATTSAAATTSGASSSLSNPLVDAVQSWIEHLFAVQRTIDFVIIHSPDVSSQELLATVLPGLEQVNASHWSFPRPNRFPIRVGALNSFMLSDRGGSSLDADLRHSRRHDGAKKSTCCPCSASSPWLRQMETQLASGEAFTQPSSLFSFHTCAIRLMPELFFFRRPRFSVFHEMIRRPSAVVASVGQAVSLGPLRSPCTPSPPVEQAADRAAQGNDDDAEVALQSLVKLPSSPFTVIDIVKLGAALYAYNIAKHSSPKSWAKFANSDVSASSFWHAAAQFHYGASANSFWQWMLWQPGVLRKQAVAYVGSEKKSIAELKKWTRLRWSRYQRVEFSF